MRILFMGTPDFAVGSLQMLIRENYNIIGIITAPDKPAGRGRKLRQSAVKIFATEKKLSVFQPTNLKDPEFLSKLKALRIDLQIVVAFRMLPKVIWEMPKLGTINLHASLLPEYRGAAPINWVIINGENRTGVTTFFINEKIDEGSILLQEEVPIVSTTSAGELHDILMNMGSNLILKTIKLVETGNYNLIKQEAKKIILAPKLNKNNCKIEWSDSMINIFNKIRGLSPYPGAWCYIENNGTCIEVKLYKSELLEEKHTLPLGKLIITKSEIKVVVNYGFIRILELKIAGKRKMDAKSLLNGYTFDKHAKML